MCHLSQLVDFPDSWFTSEFYTESSYDMKHRLCHPFYIKTPLLGILTPSSPVVDQSVYTMLAAQQFALTLGARAWTLPGSRKISKPNPFPNMTCVLWIPSNFQCRICGHRTRSVASGRVSEGRVGPVHALLGVFEPTKTITGRNYASIQSLRVHFHQYF